jgi:hypothetical protein
MLDVHAVHAAAHTWKDFFIHIATIAVGLLPKLQTNLAVFQFLHRFPGALAAKWPGSLDWLALFPAFVDTAWKTAQQSTVLQYMPHTEVKQDAELYTRLQAPNERFQAQFLALNEARRFAISDPDPSHFSPAQVERQGDLTSEVLLQYALAARLQNNLAAYYADCTPSPTRDDVYRILHATTDPGDQQAISTLNERVPRFEQQQGVDSLEPPSDEGSERRASLVRRERIG